MKKLAIDFDELQKAMEDIARDAFDYFLDTETGEVLILSRDILGKAEEVLSASMDEDIDDYEEVEFDQEQDVPDWMEDEVELALDIFLHTGDKYLRIPERDSAYGFEVMKKFTETLPVCELRTELIQILDGKGAFRNFKNAIDPYPKERKSWYGFNAKAVRSESESWLNSLGIEPGDVK